MCWGKKIKEMWTAFDSNLKKLHSCRNTWKPTSPSFSLCPPRSLSTCSLISIHCSRSWNCNKMLALICNDLDAGPWKAYYLMTRRDPDLRMSRKCRRGRKSALRRLVVSRKEDAFVDFSGCYLKMFIRSDHFQTRYEGPLFPDKAKQNKTEQKRQSSYACAILLARVRKFHNLHKIAIQKYHTTEYMYRVITGILFFSIFLDNFYIRSSFT